jgi:hypothetical protein
MRDSKKTGVERYKTEILQTICNSHTSERSVISVGMKNKYYYLYYNSVDTLLVQTHYVFIRTCSGPLRRSLLQSPFFLSVIPPYTGQCLCNVRMLQNILDI